jgi:hypothetical protein
VTRRPHEKLVTLQKKPKNKNYHPKHKSTPKSTQSFTVGLKLQTREPIYSLTQKDKYQATGLETDMEVKGIALSFRTKWET